jgi:hypothetical protein
VTSGWHSRSRARRPAFDTALHDELLALAAAPDTVATRERLWAVLDDHEAWPGRALVGDDGAEAAWFVAQRALDDVGLQARCLELLEVAVDVGDADPVHHAFLEDRMRMHHGHSQRYGSQFVLDGDGVLVPWPLDDPVAVDARRARLGLPTMADHADAMARRWQELQSAQGRPGEARPGAVPPDAPGSARDG